MRIQLTLDPTRLWSWQVCLAKTLAQKPGIELSVFWKTPPAPLPKITETLLLLEDILSTHRLFNIHRVSRSALDDSPVSTFTTPNRYFDLCCNLSGHPHTPQDDYVCFTPVYDGFPDEQIALLALLEERAPLLGILDSRNIFAMPLAEATLSPQISLASRLEAVFALVQEMLLKFILQFQAAPTLQTNSSPNTAFCLPAPLFTEAGKAGASRIITEHLQASTLSRPWPIIPPSKQAVKTRPVLRYLQQTLTQRLTQYLKNRLGKGKTPSWHLLWSLLPPGLNSKCPASPSTRIFRGETGTHYRDPFPFYYGGEHYLFFTYHSPRSEYSSIACIQLNRAASHTSPKTVPQAGAEIILERPFNISHPTLFEYDGHIWMIPVSADNRTVELYRAARFPDKWVFERMLFEDLSLHAITLYHQQSGLQKKGSTDTSPWFMFAATKNWHGSGHDTLMLYHAQNPTQEWQPDTSNPLLLEAGKSEPAGNLFQYGTHLLRPVQNWQNGNPETLFYEILKPQQLGHGPFEQKRFLGSQSQTPSQEAKWGKFTWKLPQTSRVIFEKDFMVCDRLAK